MTRSPLHTIIQFAASSRGAKLVLAGWLLLVIILSLTAPTAKQYAVNAGEGHVRTPLPAAVAKQLAAAQFPAAEGIPALLVFHNDNGAITPDQESKIAALSQWLASPERPAEIAGALPFHAIPEAARSSLFSADRSTVLLGVQVKDGLPTDRIMDALDAVKSYWHDNSADQLRLEMTGPAAIASDTLTLFRNADFVLMAATVILILVLLIAIYRSPLLAIFPLLIAGIVYAAVDRLIGLAGKMGWFTIDKQSLSIMMILLFAVITDYCLFVFSRYRETLAQEPSKYTAMGKAMQAIAEPILFSGGTICIAMLTLFAAVFRPYNGFAPVFTIAVITILLAGLTLIPALFALLGRKAFWPFIPKLAAENKPAERSLATAKNAKLRIWERIGSLVTNKPRRVLLILVIPLLLAATQTFAIPYSFNLMKSFPSDVSSRAGFDLLEKQYPVGELAPVNVILQSEHELTPNAELVDSLKTLMGQMQSRGNIDRLQPEPQQLSPERLVSMIGQDKRTLSFSVVLHVNPYDQEALNLLAGWREDSGTMLQASGLNPQGNQLHFAGQTADQLDVRSMNTRDTSLVFALIAILITLMLAIQTRSFIIPVYMMLTIILSYAATMGLTWIVFHYGLAFESFSYRLPLYTFVFMVALGIDYNIMLVSRIKEEAQKRPWREAVREGIAATGGVISSAGLILAATFGVLITQPIQELFLFGFAMAAGILIDTFLVRGMLLPALLTIGLNNKSFNQNSSMNVDQ